MSLTYSSEYPFRETDASYTKDLSLLTEIVPNKQIASGFELKNNDSSNYLEYVYTNQNGEDSPVLKLNALESTEMITGGKITKITVTNNTDSQGSFLYGV